MNELRKLKNKPILLFSFILLLKSAVAWYVVFDDGLNWSMVLTEVPIFIIIFSLIEWFAAKRKVLYYMIANLSITLIYFAVLMYYKYYGVIATYHALRQVKKVANVGESTYSLIAPYYLFIFVDLVFFLLLVIRPKYIKGWMSNTSVRMNRKILITLTAISLGICTFNIWPHHASMNEHKKAESMGILGYELYTSDAEFVVNTSFYAPDNKPATSSDYMNKRLPSLPRLLGNNGYFTATFHTNSIEFWNRSALYEAIGFTHYYDQSFYGDEDHIAFGASDEVLFAKTAQELYRLDAEEQPFYAMVISMSAHHPFHFPEEKYKMELPRNYEDTLLGDYIRAQNYADYALGLFVEDLQSSGLWEDSLIVFYGDHQGIPMYTLSIEEKQQLSALIGHEYGYTDMFNIPFIVHSPGGGLPPLMSSTGGQVDILPTVANLLGVSAENQLHFGQDLFNQDSNVLPIRHFLPTGSFVNDQSIYVTGNGYADGENYSLEDNESRPGGSTVKQFEAAQRLLEMSNSYLLQLPDKAN